MSVRLAQATALAGLALMLGSCAPRVVTPPALDTAQLPARYAAALLQREELGRGFDADVRIWIEGEAFGELPGVSGLLLLGGPDRCRLRVGSAFGTLLDVAARGDTVTALVPARRMLLEVPAAGETLGVRFPGALAFRVWSAAWRPPAEAWSGAERRDSAVVVRWTESGDSLELAVDRRGRPGTVRMTRAGGADLTCRYLGWEGVGAIAWPSWLVFEDAAGTVRAECRVSAMRPRSVADAGRLVPRVPSGVRRFEWSEVRATIERLGRL